MEPEPGYQVRCHLYDPDHAPKDVAIWRRMPVVPEEYREQSPIDLTKDKAAIAADDSKEETLTHSDEE